jgi:2-keto-4-pentenoate hydratase/2-oxohepta-3-ene-1,7-dioic acid hydratase in catechol pathway
MRLVTYTSGPAGTPRLGVRVGHRILDVENASRVDGEPLPAGMKALLREGRGALSRVQALAKAAQSNAGRYAGAMLEERAIRFLSPAPETANFVSISRNYRSHNGATGEPELSVKRATGLAGHNAKIGALDSGARATYAPQLVYVIGRSAKGVDPDDALDYIVGVTLLNELGSMGPELVTIDEIADPDDVWLTCSVNGQERMRFNTREQVWKLPDILARFTSTRAAEPGDLFSTGAPNGQAAALKTGDIVESAIEGVTTLRVTVGAPGDNS